MESNSVSLGDKQYQFSTKRLVAFQRGRTNLRFYKN